MSDPNSQSNRVSGRGQWFHWLLTLAAVTLAGVFLIPFFRSQPESIHTFFGGLASWQRTSFVFALCVAFAALLFRLFDPRASHLGHLPTRPPMWLAWAAATVVLGIVDLTIGLSRGQYTASIWEWLGYAGGSIALVLLYVRLTTPAPKKPDRKKETPCTGAGVMPTDWPTLEAWLDTDEPAKHDFLGNYVVAERLKGLLTGNTRSIGIVGAFGAGKSTIVKWIRGMVEDGQPQNPPPLLFSEHSCWGFESSASAIHAMLADGIKTVAPFIDTFHVKSLPESYRQVFSAGGQWLDSASKLFFRPGDPMQQFRTLSDLLQEVGSRLVFVVEDLDRNNSQTFDIQDVLAFLQQLKGFSNLSFVLTGGLKSPARIDFAKLCDHIEYLKTLDSSQACALVGRLRERCLDQAFFPHEALANTESNRWSPMSYALLSCFDGVWPPEAMARLLNTPRSLRHALAKTYHAWKCLGGEVDWDHLFAVNVLQSAAPECLSFLMRHWNRLSSEPSAQRIEPEHLRRIQKTIGDDWNSSTEDVEWDTRAARSLMDFVLPATDAWLGGRGQPSNNPIQGVQHERYWRRAVSGSLDRGDVRDQTVLRDLREWSQSLQPESALVSGLCGSADYCNVWEHLASWYWRSSIPQMLAATPQVISNAEQVLLLSQQVLSRISREHGSAASADCQGFHSVWRCANHCVPHTERNRDWLKDRITEAMPVSLALINSLFHYWASSRFSILRQEDRDDVRRHVLESAQRELSTALQLRRVVHPKYPYSIYQLVFDPGEDDQPTIRRDVDSWKWLGPLLLEALRQEDTTIALEICHLVSGTRSAGFDDGRRQVDLSVLHGFFGQETAEVIQLLDDSRSRLADENRKFVGGIVESTKSTQSQPATESPKE